MYIYTYIWLGATPRQKTFTCGVAEFLGSKCFTKCSGSDSSAVSLGAVSQLRAVADFHKLRAISCHK